MVMNSKDIEAFYRIAATLNDEHRAIAARHQRMATNLAKLYELIPALIPTLLRPEAGRRSQRKPQKLRGPRRGGNSGGKKSLHCAVLVL